LFCIKCFILIREGEKRSKYLLGPYLVITKKTLANPPANLLRKYLFFPIYYVSFIDVLTDIEKY
jgi:hypothetical protein